LDSMGWAQDRDLWLGEVRFAGLKATTERDPLMCLDVLHTPTTSQ